ncbi:hypothetical protein ABZP36_006420 [Zizania latifolia]
MDANGSATAHGEMVPVAGDEEGGFLHVASNMLTLSFQGEVHAFESFSVERVQGVQAAPPPPLPPLGPALHGAVLPRSTFLWSERFTEIVGSPYYMAPEVIAEHLSEEEAADIKDMFNKIDVNNNDKLTFEDFKASIRKLGNQMSDSDIKILMDDADVDKNGTLDYAEFVVVSIHVRKIGNDKHIQKAFSYFDKNKSGYIEIEELREVLVDELDGNDEDIINGIIRDVDTDKSGPVAP